MNKFCIFPIVTAKIHPLAGIAMLITEFIFILDIFNFPIEAYCSSNLYFWYKLIYCISLSFLPLSGGKRLLYCFNVI